MAAAAVVAVSNGEGVVAAATIKLFDAVACVVMIGGRVAGVGTWGALPVVRGGVPPMTVEPPEGAVGNGRLSDALDTLVGSRVFVGGGGLGRVWWTAAPYTAPKSARRAAAFIVNERVNGKSVR